MRYIVALLIAIGLVVIFIIILMRAIFGGGDAPVEQKQVNLADYDRTNVVMRLVVDGPVTADEEHRQVHIQVGRDGNTVQIIRGYQGEVIRKEQTNSNSSAYGNFLRAIDLLGYSDGNKSKAQEDYRGHCPFGQRYIFQIMDGNDLKQQFWSTSCNDGSGSFHGQSDQIVELFQAQIPNYSTITEELSF